MTAKKLDKKNNYIGFRLSEKDIHRIEQISKVENRSKGLIAKQAVKNWLNLDSFRRTNNMIIISKSVFYRLLSCADKETLNITSQEIGDLIADITKFMIAKPMELENFDEYAKSIIRFLSITGIKWFNRLDINLENNKLKIKGLHDLDEHFSEFIYQTILYFYNTYFDLELSEIMKEVSSNLLYLEFEIVKE